ncbi:MAG: hypothetical protein V2I33_17475 [Kangiellaceae bacterium]|jgi:hypothetical protein|nr:hypothetical protein [Kangiellaceae bacterium]
MIVSVNKRQFSDAFKRVGNIGIVSMKHHSVDLDLLDDINYGLDECERDEDY